jgi:hypothetical protein
MTKRFLGLLLPARVNKFTAGDEPTQWLCIGVEQTLRAQGGIDIFSMEHRNVKPYAVEKMPAEMEKDAMKRNSSSWQG